MVKLHLVADDDDSEVSTDFDGMCLDQLALQSAAYLPYEEAHKVITSNPDRPMFYVGDDSHMVTLMAREDGKDGLEVRHSTHGGRANRHHVDEINTKGPSPVTMGPRGIDLNYRDAVANHWISHFKESPHVTQGLPLVGGLGLKFGINKFGKSAPYKDIYKHFGLTANNISKKTKNIINN